MVDYEPDPCNSGAILFDLSPYRGGTTIKVYPPIVRTHGPESKMYRSTVRDEIRGTEGA